MNLRLTHDLVGLWPTLAQWAHIHSNRVPLPLAVVKSFCDLPSKITLPHRNSWQKFLSNTKRMATSKTHRSTKKKERKRRKMRVLSYRMLIIITRRWLSDSWQWIYSSMLPSNFSFIGFQNLLASCPRYIRVLPNRVRILLSKLEFPAFIASLTGILWQSDAVVSLLLIFKSFPFGDSESGALFPTEVDHNSTWVHVILDFQMVWREPISIFGLSFVLFPSFWASRVFGAFVSSLCSTLEVFGENPYWLLDSNSFFLLYNLNVLLSFDLWDKMPAFF